MSNKPRRVTVARNKARRQKHNLTREQVLELWAAREQR